MINRRSAPQIKEFLLIFIIRYSYKILIRSPFYWVKYRAKLLLCQRKRVTVQPPRQEGTIKKVAELLRKRLFSEIRVFCGRKYLVTTRRQESEFRSQNERIISHPDGIGTRRGRRGLIKFRYLFSVFSVNSVREIPLLFWILAPGFWLLNSIIFIST